MNDSSTISNYDSNSFSIECRGLNKSFKDGDTTIKVLVDVSLQVARGESVAILGTSGSGKSTLLHLLGGLDKPDSGQVFIAGENFHTISERRRCAMRNKHLGFVYQFHHLLPEFSALENVAMPLLLGKCALKEAKRRAEELLRKVGLGERLQHKISQLSGGERQRTAITRALITEPLCILADEPTGNLDHKTADAVTQIMLDLNRQLNTSLLIVTHDHRIAAQMDRIMYLEDGCLQEWSAGK